MKVVVFGANDDAIDFIRKVRAMSFFTEIEITAVIDNDSRLHGSIIEGYKVTIPESLKKITYDKLIVCPIFFDEIHKQLLDLGVVKEKIYQLHSNTFFSRSKRVFRGNFIGRYSYFKSNTKILNSDIGNFCHIGDNCIIGQAGHRTDLPTTYPLRYHFSNVVKDVSKDDTRDERRFSKRTSVGNDVYIGENVVIQGGVKIGDGAVIASRSVVTKDVEPYSIVAGVPAKRIRNRFDDDIIKDLLDIKWWDWEDKIISLNINAFSMDIESFIKHMKNVQLNLKTGENEQ